MTRSRQQGKSSHTWRALFEQQGAMLTAAVEILLLHCVSPGQILDEALMALEGSPQSRDTALLLGMSDANIHQLQMFAEKRNLYSCDASFFMLPHVFGLFSRSQVGSQHGNRVSGIAQ